MKAYLIAIGVVVGGLLATQHAHAQASTSTPVAPRGKQVVVLRNGSVLEGEVFSLGDYYRVNTGTTEMRLAARDVERVVPTLLHAYDAKRAERNQWQADDHLRLAAWCIRQEMWPQAAREINDARVREAQHPALAMFEHRLATAARAAERRAQGAIDEAAPAATTPEEEAAVQELAALNELAKTLPEGSLEEFTRNIQPLLVNNCALAGCHSPTDERSFRMNRDLLHGMANRRSTLRNLDAVWTTIDEENLDESPLLVMSATAHGGMTQPPFTGHRQKLHERIVEWAQKATGTQPVVPATAELPLDPADVSELEEPVADSSEMAPAAFDEQLPTNEAAAQDDPHFWEVDGTGKKIENKMRRGTTARSFTPRDEFDPEIFNRQQTVPPPEAAAVSVPKTPLQPRVSGLPGSG